jgi:segregation and condensation protein A
MEEKKITWWQNAFGRVGLFSKPPEPLPYRDDGFLQRLDEILAAETALTGASSNSQTSSAAPAEAVGRVSVRKGAGVSVPTPVANSVPDRSTDTEPAFVLEAFLRHRSGKESVIESANVAGTTSIPEPSPVADRSPDSAPVSPINPAGPTEEAAPQPTPIANPGAKRPGVKRPLAKRPKYEKLSIREISPIFPPQETWTQAEPPVPPAVEFTPAIESAQAEEPTLVSTEKPDDTFTPDDSFTRFLTSRLPPPPIPAPNPSHETTEVQKKLTADDDDSPFSVSVGQVYDGPLDLLLDLIRKQDIDIYDIPIAKITAQFLAYVNHLNATDVDVAGEFIYTASLLIHIKSKMLLPRSPAGPDDAPEDPRRELVERLLEHERFKNAAQMLQQKQMLEAATWTNPGVREFQEEANDEPDIAADTVDLVRVFHEILERARKRPVIDLEEDTATVGEMIQFLARRLSIEDNPVALRSLLSNTRSEKALVAIFLALLELVRLQAILLRQDRAFSEIFIKKHSGFDAVMNEGLANARDDWR